VNESGKNLQSKLCNITVLRFFPQRSECETPLESYASSPCYAASKAQVEHLFHPPISSHDLKTVYPNNNNTPGHLGYLRIYHRLHRDPDLGNNRLAAAAGNTWAAAGMARHKDQAAHKVLVDIPAGRDLGSRCTGSVEVSLDSLAHAGLPDLHRNGGQVVDSRAAALQALSTSTVSKHECLTECLDRAYVLVRHCGVDWVSGRWWVGAGGCVASRRRFSGSQAANARFFPFPEDIDTESLD
jgi:hypothetical protein